MIIENRWRKLASPSQVYLSNTSIAEGNSIGEQVGEFSSDVDDAVFTLVSGTGSDDNARFTLDTRGNQSLLAAESFKKESRPYYKIRVRATNDFGAKDQQFTITMAASGVDPRQIGYIVLNDYEGADPTGTSDSSSAIEQALRDAGDVEKMLLISYGTYRVTRPLHYNQYRQKRSNLSLPVLIVGEKGPDGQLPRIFLDDFAEGFQNLQQPNAMLSLRFFEVERSSPQPITNVGPVPAHIFDIPDGVKNEKRNSNYYCGVRDIEFVCYRQSPLSNPGAIGLHFPSAEDSFVYNVKIDAGGGLACFGGLGGTGDPQVKLECSGGQYGIYAKEGLQGGGLTIAGLKCSGQTKAAVYAGDFCPTVVVGFEFDLPEGTYALETTTNKQTARGTIGFIDGKITANNDSLVFKNDWVNTGKSIYLKDVYIAKSSNLIKSGSRPIISQPGTWKWIKEYSYTNQQKKPADDSPYELKDEQFDTFSIIDGKISAMAEPVIDITSGIPPPDMHDRHVPDFPAYYGQADGTKVISIAPYSVNFDEIGFDCQPVIQQAISDAVVDGVGVFIPPASAFGKSFNNNAFYYVGHSIFLPNGAKVMGAWHRNTGFAPNASFISKVVNNSGERFIFETEDSTNASVYIGFTQCFLPTGGGNSSTPSPEEWFGSMHIRSGKAVTAFNIIRLKYNGPPKAPPVNLHALKKFSGSAGGRHYASVGHNGMGKGFVVGNPNIVGFHMIRIDGVDGLILYGLHSPMDGPLHHANKIENSSNIRVYGMSAEETHIMWWIVDSKDIIWVGLGRNRTNPHTAKALIEGKCSGITVALLCSQSVENQYDENELNAHLREGLDGMEAVEIKYPSHVSIYKRT